MKVKYGFLVALWFFGVVAWCGGGAFNFQVTNSGSTNWAAGTYYIMRDKHGGLGYQDVMQVTDPGAGQTWTSGGQSGTAGWSYKLTLDYNGTLLDGPVDYDGAQTVIAFVWDGGNPVAGVSYTWDKCFTNNSTSGLYADVTVEVSAGYTNSYMPAMQHLSPGDYHCWSLTNGQPFSARLHAEVYNDTVPPVGGDTPWEDAVTNGVAKDPSFSIPPMTPLPGPSGNNAATASDIGTLSTNIQLSVYGVGISLGRGIGDLKGQLESANRTLERIRTNTVPGTNGIGDYGAVLERIRTNTESSASSSGAILQNLTNVSGVLADAGSAQTNGASAWAWASGQVATNGIGDRVNSISNNVGALSTLGTVGEGSDENFVFEFCGREIDLNPNSAFMSGITNHIKFAWTIITLVLFAYSMGKLLFDLFSRLLPTTAAGALVSFGAVGFAARTIQWAFASGVSIGITLLFSILGNVIMDMMSEKLGLIPEATSNFEWGMGFPLAVWLINATLPVGLIFGCIVTRLSVMFGGAGLVFTAAAASKILVGR